MFRLCRFLTEMPSDVERLFSQIREANREPALLCLDPGALHRLACPETHDMCMGGSLVTCGVLDQSSCVQRLIWKRKHKYQISTTGTRWPRNKARIRTPAWQSTGHLPVGKRRSATPKTISRLRPAGGSVWQPWLGPCFGGLHPHQSQPLLVEPL